MTLEEFTEKFDKSSADFMDAVDYASRITDCDILKEDADAIITNIQTFKEDLELLMIDFPA